MEWPSHPWEFFPHSGGARDGTLRPPATCSAGGPVDPSALFRRWPAQFLYTMPALLCLGCISDRFEQLGQVFVLANQFFLARGKGWVLLENCFQQVDRLAKLFNRFLVLVIRGKGDGVLPDRGGEQSSRLGLRTFVGQSAAQVQGAG